MANKLSTTTIVIALVAIALFTGVVKIPTGQTGSVVPTGNNPTQTLNCPSLAQNFIVSVAYPDFTKSPIQLTLVASQTINAYAQTPAVSTTVTATASSSSSAGTALTSLNCGGSYLLTAGDNSGYFLNYTTQNIGTSINLPVTIVAPKYSAVTITASNSVNTAPSASAQQLYSQSASKTLTGYLTVQAGQYTASAGPMALSFSYNSASIQSVSVSGLSPTTAAVPAMVFENANTVNSAFWIAGVENSQVTYLLPSLANYQYSNGNAAPSSGQVQIPVQIVTTSSAGVANELIGVQIVAGTNFYNSATGQVQSGVYKNPLTNANIFSPVAFAHAFELNTKAS